LAIQEACIQGVSTRSVDDLVKAMGMTGISCAQADAERLAHLIHDGSWNELADVA
jgi:hypothetical protein